MMKLLGLLAAAALHLPVETLAMSASLSFKDTLLADSSERTVSFDALPYDLALLADDVAAHAMASTSNVDVAVDSDGHITCLETDTTQNNGTATVLLAFSNCLNDTALGVVNQWVNQIKTTISTIAQGENLAITFQSTMVPGSCEAVSQKTTQGVTGPTVVNQGGTPSPKLLANEVQLSDLQRLEAFSTFGNIVNLADDTIALTSNPIAAISFVTGKTSYGEVMQYLSTAHVTKSFNFQICDGGPNCDGTFANCIKLQQTVDLFMYNPFTVTRSLSCASLDNGVPVTYLDTKGARKCFCGCPAGYEMGQNDAGNPACTKKADDTCPCVWATCKGFYHKITTNEAICSFKNIATNWGVPVPFPTDGYVADKRDSLSEGFKNPRITVTAARQQSPEYKGSDILSAVGASASLPLTFKEVVGIYSKASSFTPVVAGTPEANTYNQVTTWKDYQINRQAHIDDLNFTSYGKYHLQVNAYDYYSGATCDGCFALVDSNRPTATTICPKNFCDYVADSAHCTDTAELTATNLDKANNLTLQYADFKAKAQNDACSVNNRCDYEAFSRRDFYDKTYKDRACNTAPQCFDKGQVMQDLLNNVKTKTNPLVQTDKSCDNTDAPVPVGQCTRCCKMETALKEWWTDYRCGSDYDARYCDGDSHQSCAFQQCLVMNGDTLATVTATITKSAQAESQNVLSQIDDQGYQTVTQIHRALDCTSFGGTDGTCDFRAKLSELIDTTEALNFPSTYGQPTDYVYWRSKVVADGESWNLWKTAKQSGPDGIVYQSDDVLTFSNPETKIVLEAWTQCGLVRRFFFYVHLHVNSPVSVCAKFNDMWYQTSVSRLPIGTGVCAYPGSDFAELTFDFHPNAGLQYSREELKMKVTKVECTGYLAGRAPVSLLNVTQNSPEIVTRFAVTMLNKAKTEAATGFHVDCVFTYAKYGGASDKETCSRDFSISDCKGPAFDYPDATCQYDDCAGNTLAGLYEACGGTVVKADEKTTYVERGEKPCCQGCKKTEVVCTPLLDLPNADADIMRCEPTGAGSYSNYKTAYAVLLLTETAQEHPAATALLSATALIAVVALVVVRRRVVALQSAQTVDDAYYPLLH